MGADYSQIELRVMAEVANEPTMLQEFLDGKDPYASTAALLSQMDYEDFCALEKPDYKKRRQNAKAVRLGYQYGMGWRKFKTYAKQTYGVSMTDDDAYTNRVVFFEVYSKLVDYHNQFSSPYCLEVRTIAPFHRRRVWLEYPGIPQLCNHPIQGTSADITKLSLALLFERLYDDGYSPTQSQDVKMSLTIHDEDIIEATIEKGEYGKLLLEKCMKDAGETVLKVCPVDCEAKIMNNLSEKE